MYNQHEAINCIGTSLLNSDDTSLILLVFVGLIYSFQANMRLEVFFNPLKQHCSQTDCQESGRSVKSIFIASDYDFRCSCLAPSNLALGSELRDVCVCVYVWTVKCTKQYRGDVQKWLVRSSVDCWNYTNEGMQGQFTGHGFQKPINGMVSEGNGKPIARIWIFQL